MKNKKKHVHLHVQMHTKAFAVRRKYIFSIFLKELYFIIKDEKWLNCLSHVPCHLILQISSDWVSLNQKAAGFEHKAKNERLAM